MEEFKLYSISDEYVEWLRKDFPNVYSNKIDSRTHTRKYLGVVLKIEQYNYYIPMFSPKDSDYQIAGNSKVIKKSIVPIIRIVVKNSAGEKELKGTLRISHMIPVPETELELYDLEGETDSTYKDLVQNEMIFIRKNREKIISNAELLYKQKTINDTTAGYVKSALDYKKLEQVCSVYKDSKCKTIGSIVKVIVDRPLGTSHPEYKDLYYPINYGYVSGVMALDGEEQDAYILGVDKPIKEFIGKVIAIIHRIDDVEDKWVVAPEDVSFTKDEIMQQIEFQEQYFHTEIRM